MDVSDANTKVYGDGHTPFQLCFLFSCLFVFSMGLRQANKKNAANSHSIFCRPGP